MAHTDTPSRAEIIDLASITGRTCLSLYLPIGETGHEPDHLQLEFNALVSAGLDQVTDKTEREVIGAALARLTEWPEFWRYQSRTLVVHATTDSVRTYRLPNRLEPVASAGDRFYIKPMLRAVSFPQTAFVLALAEGSVRLVHIHADKVPEVVEVPGLPESLESLLGKPERSGYGPGSQPRNPDGQSTRVGHYVRAVDRALRTTLTGHGIPLILAAAEPIASTYRSVSTYPGLLPRGIGGNAESLAEGQLSESARPVLDDYYREQVAQIRDQFEDRRARGLGRTDLAEVAKAATFGAVDTVLIDIDGVVPGTIHPDSGEVQFSETQDGRAGGVVNEIARRALLSGSTVMAVRSEDMPDGARAAAILRYAV